MSKGGFLEVGRSDYDDNTQVSGARRPINQYGGPAGQAASILSHRLTGLRLLSAKSLFEPYFLARSAKFSLTFIEFECRKDNLSQIRLVVIFES